MYLLKVSCIVLFYHVSDYYKLNKLLTIVVCSNRFEAYFYIFYFIYLIVIFINLINSNPGRLHGKKSSLLHLVENHANIVEYCPICIVILYNFNLTIIKLYLQK